MYPLVCPYPETKLTNFLKHDSSSQNISLVYNFDIRMFYNSYLKHVRICRTLKDITRKVISDTIQCDIRNVGDFKIDGQGF